MFSRREALSAGTAVLAVTAADPGIVRAAESAERAGERVADARARENHFIRLDSPAESPLDALPVGNGRLGAMIAGQPNLETIPLNEDTLWAGQPHPFAIGDGRDALDKIREAVFAQDYSAADAHCQKIQGQFCHSYAPMANLHLAFDHEGPVRDYNRALDLDEAVATVAYSVGDTRFTREVLASHPAQLILMRLRSNQPEKLNVALRLDSLLRHESAADESGINLQGKAPTYCAPSYRKDAEPVVYSDEPGWGMHFATRLEILSTDGDVSADQQGLRVEKASEIVLAIGAATGFRGSDRMPDLRPAEVLAKAIAPLPSARSKGFDAVRNAHAADHRSLYRRAELALGRAKPNDLPTDKQLAANREHTQPSLAVLYFNFSRYLLIASSRPGTQAVNLQGIWNWEVRPPWSCNYTTNINVQQNYWGAEVCNLPELAGPMIDFIEQAAVTGAETAARLYGMKGWCMHHNSDLWRLSTPVGMGDGGPTWANYALAGPWLVRHVWEHYLYSQDLEFLATRGYPLLKGCAEFCVDWLVRDPRNGHLTTAPSVSPENSFGGPDGGVYAVSAGCTMDIAMIREVFTFTREAAALLGIDAAFAAHLQTLEERLPSYRIGRHGQLQEWEFDFEEPEPGQRHISHLYPVSPGWEITPRSKPELARAVSISLQRRLAAQGGGTGWGAAWAVHVFARLGDGKRALENFNALLANSTSSALLDFLPGPVFQIDGNFAGGAAVAEMILQSHARTIAFLPALPLEWETGSFKGARARGGVTIDMDWAGCKMVRATLYAAADGTHVLRPPEGQRITRMLRGRQTMPFHSADGGYRVTLKAGERYSVRFC